MLLVYPKSEIIPQNIRLAFKDLGQEGINWGLRIAQCESGFNPYNVNRTDGQAKGLYQFKIGTFMANAKRIRIKNPDIWNWAQQIKVARYMFSIGQQRQWECR